MWSQMLAPARRSLIQPFLFRPSLSVAASTRSFTSVRTSLCFTKHSTLCRCVSCSRPSLLRLSSLPARAFSGDAHAEHSHGDFLDPHVVESRVLAVLRNIEKLSGASISASSTWRELGLDSLDEVEVVMQLEEEFMVDLYDPDAVKITGVKEAVEVFSNFPFAM